MKVAAEKIKTYRSRIEEEADRAYRSDYQRACAIIRNLKKAGGQKQIPEIKQKLFNKYAKHKASSVRP